MESKKSIICLVGKSGSGKSLVSDYIEKKYGIQAVQSWTTREPRYEGEKGHTFATEEQYNNTSLEDILAYTKFGDSHYWTVHKDISKKCLYVIDEIGYKEMKNKFSDIYDIKSIWVDRKDELRDVSQERKNRDKGMFDNDSSIYDIVIYNNDSKKLLEYETDLALFCISAITSRQFLKEYNV